MVREGLAITHLYPGSYSGFIKQQGKIETLAPLQVQVDLYG